jgi:hypothetical protein
MGRNMRTLCLLLVSVCACYGQAWTFLDPAFVCQTNVTATTDSLNDVTNYLGYPALAIYIVSTNNYVTNAGMVQLTDLGTNAFHFTNSTAAKRPIRQIASSDINGKDSILFNGTSAFLRSITYTSQIPHEILMVMKWSDTTNGSYRTILDGYDGTVSQNSSKVPSGLLRFRSSGSYSETPSIVTNKWMVWDFIVTPTANYLYTNNSLAATDVNTQTRSMNGFTIGSSANASEFFSPLNLALLVSFGATNGDCTLPGTDITARNAMFTALTNYFKLIQ